MTIKDVEDAIALIRSVARDPEAAHSYEDTLYLDVLMAIAEGTAEDPVKMAALAIKTQDLEFDRWCA